MLTEHLTERLKEITANASQLSPEAQDKLAEEIANALENALWDAQLRDPQHLEVLRELAEEARQGPKLPMPMPHDTGDDHLLDPDDLRFLADGERDE
ncbi:MAG TPA: hypothetical protein VKT52_11545 [Ktedonobacterales bacterium]|nr:hypothetical protein [Ktedonobacterales bacterium]